ncbi:MAG: NYN domain-containing protein [Verrucomicrobiae bacterium]|nr:NYN domain-containing protein [Verrucomicrobiae bacterium]
MKSHHTHHLIVDGHSVIHAWEDLRKLHVRRQAAAREELLQRLSVLHDQTEYAVTVVFDGRGEGKPELSREPGGMQVAYSVKDQTADAVIERMVAGFRTPDRIVVVTNDNAERMTVESFGAMVLDADALEDLLDHARTDQGGQLEKIKNKARGFGRRY